jgi:hypothetical protein
MQAGVLFAAGHYQPNARDGTGPMDSSRGTSWVLPLTERIVHARDAENHMMIVLVVRLRFWVESVFAVGGCGLAVLTFFGKDWMEALFHVGLDGGTGSLEWSVSIGLALIGLTNLFLPYREWRSEARSGRVIRNQPKERVDHA